ncbi:hypothetical protein [Nostoc sp. 'Peltigera membranacea cyanobiont' N6]|nr:hypothetical protein [Nostoc sp. 'Peltigera membranacea cyanobiont' N6]
MPVITTHHAEYLITTLAIGRAIAEGRRGRRGNTVASQKPPRTRQNQ